MEPNKRIMVLLSIRSFTRYLQLYDKHVTLSDMMSLIFLDKESGDTGRVPL